MFPPRAIVFDAGGTLLHPDPPAAVLYAEVGRRYGSRLRPEVLGPRFRAAFRREEEADRAGGWRTDEAREVRRWQQIVAACLDDVSDPPACFRILYEHYAQPTAWRWEPAAAQILPELFRRGFRLGLASNYDHRLHAVLAGQPLAPLFELVLASAEIGWRKPAEQFFTALCQRLSLPPDQVLYVGDDLENDYGGGTAAGLRAILLDPHQRANLPASARITQLDELLTLLS